MDRREELDRFKQVNLSLIAAEFGFEIDRKKSTRHSVLMRRGGEKIVISRNTNHYVFFSVHANASGTVIDFVQQLVDPGCSLGEVRKLLRPFLGNSASHQLATRQFQSSYQPIIEPTEYDRVGVNRRYQKFDLVGVGDAYLAGERCIPDWVLSSRRVVSRIRRCPQLGTIVFPHWDQATGVDDAETPISGYEIKHRDVGLFSKSGQKGLWMTQREWDDVGVAFVESGLDGLSLLALSKMPSTFVCSVGGQIGGGQVEVIAAVLRNLPTGAQVVAAFDQDNAGTQLTDRLAEILAGVGRSDLEFRDERPVIRGQDWNDVIRCRHSDLAAHFESIVALS